MSQKFKKIDSFLDRRIGSFESKMKRSYQNSLDELRGYFARVYEMWGDGKTIKYDNLIARNAARVKQVQDEISRQTDLIYESNYNDIIDDLRRVYVYSYDTTSEIVGGLFGKDINPVLQLDVLDKAIKTPVAGLTIDMRFDGYRQQLTQKVFQQFGIAAQNDLTVRQLAQNIAAQMEGNGYWLKRIVETEGHRLMEEAKYNSVTASGETMLKTWVSMGDASVRDAHQQLDGSTIPVDEEFVSPTTGAKALFPGGFGTAEDDINCRCWVEYSTK